MLEESEAAEVIREQRAPSFARRPTTRELPDPQIEGAGRGGKKDSRMENECPPENERRLEGWRSQRRRRVLKKVEILRLVLI